ncbi:unnamed protein product [Symbiodinium pilosum]|uniref:Uncharacterized protein n=1 Tax=Symbiodinium pilosum TaxID=2952 RepID=A0A812S647_SYMPI|nr:unnamed protein product [Symbiodinium pilosum]
MRHSPVEDEVSSGLLPRQPAGWSHSHALHALAHGLLSAASALGRGLESACLPGLNDYDFFGNKSVLASQMNACISDAEKNTGLAIRALDEGDIPTLAEALMAWAHEPGELPWLRPGVGLAAERVLRACRGGQLGCAWRSGDEGRGSPHCLLGAQGAVQDNDLTTLRKAAVALRQQGGVASKHGLAAQRPTFTFRRSVAVYPEEMMFFVVRCERQVTNSTRCGSACVIRQEQCLAMAKATLLWFFGYRKCESCEEYSTSGWFDADDVWYCEECQMNCVLDLFSDEPVPAESWLRCGIRRVRELPALATSQLLVCTCELVKVSGHAGLFGGRLMLAGTGMALGSLWSHLQGLS